MAGVNPKAESFDDYLDKIPADKVDTTREIFELMRREVGDAQEDVRWGIAILSRNGRDITGISARNSHYSLYVPDSPTVEKYIPRLGNVDAGKGCIRFKDSADLKVSELRKMVQELAETSQQDE